MTRIDYYILNENAAQARAEFAVKLLSKIIKLGHKVYIHCENKEHAQAIDNYLWEFSQHSFLPHKLLGEEGPDCAIEIGYQDEPGCHDDVLVNLSLHIPPSYSRFQRISEIVSQDQATLIASRKNYRFYQDRNYPMQRHDMRKPR